MNLEPDFSDFIEALARNKVEFVIVGAFAPAYHGAPRATRDKDLSDLEAIGELPPDA